MNKYEVIRYPLITEKGTTIMNNTGSYSFIVAIEATKHDIKKAVEAIFTLSESGKFHRYVPANIQSPDFGDKWGRNANYIEINNRTIAKMKDGIRLINCARGGLYTEEALYEGLKSGKIAWLGIDVFDKEPATNHPLLDFENISVTSHLGANTLESQDNIAREACEQALSAARGVAYPNALNLPIKTEDLPPFVAPYIELVSKMAFLAVQIDKNPIKSIKLEAEGIIGEYANSMLTFAAVGALGGILGEKINYVNAEFVAKEKGVELSCETLPNSGYNNKLSVKIITENSNISVSGTVFNENEQRIVGLNGFKTDFKPKGKMIIFKNKDIPGVIAKISSVLATKNINIADFRLGRDGFGYALAVVLIDEKVQKEVLDELKQLEVCVFVQYVEI